MKENGKQSLLTVLGERKFRNECQVIAENSFIRPENRVSYANHQDGLVILSLQDFMTSKSS